MHTEKYPQIFGRCETQYIMYTTHSIAGHGGENGIKNWKFENLKYSLMPIGASRYDILKTIYNIST